MKTTGKILMAVSLVVLGTMTLYEVWTHASTSTAIAITSVFVFVGGYIIYAQAEFKDKNKSNN